MSLMVDPAFHAEPSMTLRQRLYSIARETLADPHLPPAGSTRRPARPGTR